MIRLQIGYGQHGSVAAQGDMTPEAAIHLFERLVAFAGHVPFQITRVVEDPGLLLIACGTHPEVPGLTPRRPPADWDGLTYRFSGLEDSPGQFRQLYTHVLVFMSRRPALFTPGARAALSRTLVAPPSIWSVRG